MPDRGPVLLGEHNDEHNDDEQDELADLVDRAVEASGDVAAALDLARVVGAQLPVPGAGRTAHLWSALASVAAVDLTVARTLEPHLDALAILDQAGHTPDPGTWASSPPRAPASRCGPRLAATATSSTAASTGAPSAAHSTARWSAPGWASGASSSPST